MRSPFALALCFVTLITGQVVSEEYEFVEVEGQPLAANVARLLDSLEFLGSSPFTQGELRALKEAIAGRDAEAIQEILHSHVLFQVHLNPESRVKVARGGWERPVLQEGGYSPVLIRIENQASVTAPLRISSPQAGKVYSGVAKLSMERQERPDLRENENTEEATDRFLEVEMYRDQPMTKSLSGLTCEYAIGLIYSSESGKREATVAFDVGDGTQDLGFRGEVPVLFDIHPAIPLTLHIRDDDGTPTTARLVFRDERGRVYPLQAKRLAPDLFFQKQVYRADGETVSLPPGKFTVQSSRGPEYRVQEQTFDVEEKPGELSFHLERWIDAEAHGFYCGDHHIHASGCAHYQFPTVGIDPSHVLPHVKGEGLNVGCILTWGPGFEHQRQFFHPGSDPVSEPLTLIKYDLEISGFGSAPLGHVCLLNLKNQTYPGSEGTKEKGWPSWTIPVMRWCKQQGGVAGYAHSASGMHVEPENEAARLVAKRDADGSGAISESEATDQLLPEDFTSIDTNEDEELSADELEASLARVADQLPNYAIPGMNGAGALEIAISSTEGVCDFISAMDTARIQEWNTWYHILNCGLRVKVSGETDFPCMAGTRVGQGRVYVNLGPGVDKLNFTEWCNGLAAGKSYVSDGYAHALHFAVNGVSPGFGAIELNEPDKVTINATVSFALETPIGVAYGTAASPLGESKTGDTVNLHIGREEGYRKGGERIVELVVNGEAVARRTVAADGHTHDLTFEIPIEQSSWVALRQFPQLHTNPVDVLVGGKPIFTNRKSARWCLECIEKLWQNREKKIREGEREEARATYGRAKEFYQKLLKSEGG